MGGINAGEARADNQDVKMFRGSCQGLLPKGLVDGMNIPQGGKNLTADSTDNTDQHGLEARCPIIR